MVRIRNIYIEITTSNNMLMCSYTGLNIGAEVMDRARGGQKQPTAKYQPDLMDLIDNHIESSPEVQLRIQSKGDRHQMLSHINSHTTSSSTSIHTVEGVSVKGDFIITNGII